MLCVNDILTTSPDKMRHSNLKVTCDYGQDTKAEYTKQQDLDINGMYKLVD